MRELSLTGFAAVIGEMAVAAHKVSEASMERAARVVEKEAKDSIGTYQDKSGPFVGWAELADSTKADRVRQGFSENDPELRTGDLRASIEHTIVRSRLGDVEAEVGSNSDVMVYQELGTAKMPPRSILGSAAVRKEREVVEIIGGGLVAALIGEEVYQGSLRIV